MKKFAVILVLGLISFLPADVPLSTAIAQLNSYSGNPAGSVVVGSVNGVARKLNASDFLNRIYFTGVEPISAVNGLQSVLDGKQALLNSGSNIKTINGLSLIGGGNLSIAGGSLDTTNTSQNTTLKKFVQDNAPTVDYATDEYSFDRINNKLYYKGMYYYPSVATAYGTVTLDPKSSNAAARVTFTSNGSTIPNDGVIFTLTFVTTTYQFTPIVDINTRGVASGGQMVYPDNESVNSFQCKIKTGFAPANGSVYYYSSQVTPASNVSGQ